jgi:hypothetical protein
MHCFFKTGRYVIAAAIVSGAFTGQVAGASASDASIKAAIKSYNAKILIAEGHVASAIGAYKQTGNPTKVQAALAHAIDVFQGLKSAIAAQSASQPRVKMGKVKLEKGLQSVAVAYKKLAKAFGEKRVSPAAAKAEAKLALSEVKKGREQLAEGLKLLK